MKRREFIIGVGATAAWPVNARTQQAMPVVGFINTASPEPFANLVRAFRDGLGKTGYVDGQKVEQATHYEFVVNLKTARTMGMTLPTSILLRADEVIE